jgi:hypothetical protein
MDARTFWTWPLVALAAFASAGTAREAESAAPVPTRCIAFWHRPVEDCRLQDPLRVEAVGRVEADARGLALDRLTIAMEAQRASHSAGAPDIMQAVVLNATRGCSEHLAEEAVVTCFPEPHLRAARYCQVQFPVPGCGAADQYAVEGSAWREGEEAREDLCLGMGRDLPHLAHDERALKTCEAQCWQTSHLECGLR